MCYIDNDIDYDDSEWDDELDTYEDDDDFWYGGISVPFPTAEDLCWDD